MIENKYLSKIKQANVRRYQSPTYLADIYAVKEFENIGIGDPEYTLVPSL
jgi:hypothetical protein